MSSAIKSQAISHSHTHYEVLRLERNDLDRLSKDDLKAAYRRALLAHHPDKAPGLNSKSTLNNVTNVPRASPYSVDEIVTAYDVLANSKKRAEYDCTLEQSGNRGWERKNVPSKDTHFGVETYDLEDLTYAEKKNTWSKICRCGDEEGYTVTESDLERESRYGEIYVGCHGCSLFIKVQFAAEET